MTRCLFPIWTLSLGRGETIPCAGVALRLGRENLPSAGIAFPAGAGVRGNVPPSLVRQGRVKNLESGNGRQEEVGRRESRR